MPSPHVIPSSPIVLNSFATPPDLDFPRYQLPKIPRCMSWHKLGEEIDYRDVGFSKSSSCMPVARQRTRARHVAAGGRGADRYDIELDVVREGG